jgi:hypothetical protein
MPHFKAFGMINLQYEIRIWKNFLNKATNDKTSQDNNLNYVNFLKHFYAYHTKKYRNIKCLNLKVFP